MFSGSRSWLQVSVEILQLFDAHFLCCEVMNHSLTASVRLTDRGCCWQESKVRFDSDEDFKKRAYSAVVKLQSYELDYVKAWTLICDESRNGMLSCFISYCL